MSNLNDDSGSVLPLLGPRVIAQCDDAGGTAWRLVWQPPLPADHPDGDGPSLGWLITERRGTNALGEPSWREDSEARVHEHGDHGAYALILKLHTEHEEAWAKLRAWALVGGSFFNSANPSDVFNSGKPSPAMRPDRPKIYLALERWRALQDRVPLGMVTDLPDAICAVNAADAALRDIYAMFDGEPVWRERYRNACQVAIEAREALTSGPVARLIAAAQAFANARNPEEDASARRVLVGAVNAWEARP